MTVREKNKLLDTFYKSNFWGTRILSQNIYVTVHGRLY